MNNPAAFKATYSDFKIIKGRKCAQVILEVPIEAANAAMEALGGVPRTDQEVWVAVARLDGGSAASAPPTPAAGTEKERRKFDTLPLPQQVAMISGKASFRRFIEDEFRNPDPIGFVYKWCGVDSRANILAGTDAANKWGRLNDKFLAWLSVDA